VFAQLMEHLPLHTFRQCVAKYPSRYPTLKFSHLDRFFCMAFAQLTYRESLRDIETCLRAHQAKALSLGHTRQHRQELAGRCQREARLSHLHGFRDELDPDRQKTLLQRQLCGGTGTDGLCTRYHDHRSVHERLSVGALPLHLDRRQDATRLDLRGNIQPSFTSATARCTRSMSSIFSGSSYIMGRGFTEFARRFALHQAQACKPVKYCC